MENFRTRLTKNGRRLAAAGEGCAHAGAICACIFIFLIGFTDRRGNAFLLLGALRAEGAGRAYLLCAAILSIAAVCVLFALTAVRLVRFLTGKTQKDSLYFSYAVCGAYHMGILLFSACMAEGTRRLNGATIAGLVLTGAGVLASVVPSLFAKRGLHGGKEAVLRSAAAVIGLVILYVLSALFSTGAVTEGDRMGLSLLFADPEAPGSRTAAAFLFLFLIGYAVCGVLLMERLLGNIARQRKPTLLRACLTAACAIASAVCMIQLAPMSEEMQLLFFRGVPAFCILLAALLVLCVLADTLISARLQTDAR